MARYSGALNSGTSGLATSKSLGTAPTRYSGRMPRLRTYPSIAAFWGCLAPAIAAFSNQRAPLLSCGATHSTHNHHRGGRHNHLPTRIMPACADLELCKAPENPPLGGTDGHGCRAASGGRLHGICGEQEEGESEMHHICNPCLDKKQKGSGGSSNQPKRRSPTSAFLQ